VVFLCIFRDGWTKATLTVLPKLAEKTQIILFAQYKRLIEQAQTLVSETSVTVHELWHAILFTNAHSDNKNRMGTCYAVECLA